MPQIQVFQCPSCGANLSYDGGSEVSFPCQFCGTTVIVPEELRPHGAAQAAPSAGPNDWGAMAPSAAGAVPLDKLAQMKHLVRNGQKIEAIKIYREVTGVGLREAKDAVERLEAGQPLVFTSGTSVEVSGLTTDQARELANEAVRAAQSGDRAEAVRLAREAAAMAQGTVPPGGIYGGGTAATPMAQPVPQVRRRSNSLGCLLGGCVGAMALGVAGVIMLGAFGAPLSMQSILKQQVEATLATPLALATRAAAPTQTPNAGATAQAKARATEQAQAKAANATATRAAGRAATSTAVAAATADAAAAEATAQAEAAATAQAVIAAQANWPAVVSEKFTSNALEWPVGPAEDDYFAITTTVKSKKYAWSFVPKRSAYANAFPLNPKTYGDFSAAVKVKFVQGDEDGNTSVGLVFRHSSSGDEYGFFGIDPNGNYRVVLAYPGSGVQVTQEDKSDAIHAGAGQVNQLTARAVGPDLVFQVNDQVVWQLSQDLPEGDFGMGVDAKDKGDSVSVEFTEFEVHAPKK